jgi:diaminopimelate epimerase
MPISFCKFHGFGNDYIVIEDVQLRGISSLNEFAKRLCNRHTGIGADGIAVLEKLDGGEADYACRIINPDGSEAGFSGNGTRCAAAYLHYKKLFENSSLRLKTLSGVKKYELLSREENTFLFRAELGKPKFAPHEIPFIADEKLSSIVNYKLALDYNTQLSTLNSQLSTVSQSPQQKSASLPTAIEITALNVGNPVCVVFVDGFEAIDWRRVGATVEVHPRFPEKTNVVFVKTLDRKNIEIRIWERGAGETSSSGTCSIAAAVASASLEKTDRQVSVRAEGGTTEALWREDDEMLITGTAKLVLCGEYFG